MNGSEFIKLSTQIVAFGSAGSRSATSRAYYGAFHEALRLLDEFGCKVPRNGAAHSITPDCLEKSTHDSAKSAGQMLSNLHTKRIKADYRLEEPGPDGTAFGKLAIEAATTIEQLLNDFRRECAKTPTLKSQLHAEVKKYFAIRKIPMT